MPQPPTIGPGELVERYEGLLLDAYGVLVDSSGPLRSGECLIAALARAAKPYFVVTNDASRLPETASRRFRRFGLDIPKERILSSGSLLKAHFEKHSLVGASARVLGPEDSQAYVRQAKGCPLPLDSDDLPEVLVVCDERGYPFLDGIDHTMTLLYRALEVDRLPHLVLANPDLLYPRGRKAWGFTAGSVALLLEAALERRVDPSLVPRFHHLGKPGPELLRAAIQTMPNARVAMVGDQISTDIASARAAGIDSVLVGEVPPGAAIRPTFQLATPADEP